MPTLEINGRRVQVNDSFMSLSPDQQNATVDEIAQSLGPQASVPEDVAKSAAVGVGEGIIGLAGLPRAIGDAGGWLASKAVGLATGREPDAGQSFQSSLQAPTTESIREGVQGVTGEFYKPQTTEGEYARTIGEFLPGGVAAAPRRLASSVLAPALASEAAGQLTEGSGVEPYARVAGALLGGGVAGAIGDARLASAAVRQAPSRESLRQAEQAAYGQAKAGGAVFDANAVDLIPAQVRQTLNAGNVIVDSRLTPAASRALQDIDEFAAGGIQNLASPSAGNSVGTTLDGLVNARKRVNSYFDATDPISGKADRRALSAISRALDDWIDNSDTALIAGSDKAVDAYREGNRLHQRGAKSDALARALDKAQRSAAASGSGGNVDNRIRQELNKVLERDRGLSAAERAALEKAVYGTKGQNALRMVGKLSPQGSGLMSGLGIGGAAVNPLAAIPFAVGAAAKPVADSLTRRNLSLADAIIRSGGQNLPAQDKRALALLLAGSNPILTGE